MDLFEKVYRLSLTKRVIINTMTFRLPLDTQVIIPLAIHFTQSQ